MDGGRRCGPRTGRPPSTCAAPAPPSRRLATGGDAWALDSVPGLIGVDDHPEEFAHRAIPLSVNCTVATRASGSAGPAASSMSFSFAIVAQKVTGREAGRGMKQLTRRYSEPAPGPMPFVFLPIPSCSPRQRTSNSILSGSNSGSRRCDPEGGLGCRTDRASLLCHAADACAYLERIRGIGVWTSAETVVVSHGDTDAVSVGDFHHKNEVAWHLTGRPRGTDEEMVKLLEEFRPHRARVMRFLASLGHAPAYGPRMPIRSIAEI